MKNKIKAEEAKNLLDQDRNDELQHEEGRDDYPGDEVDHALHTR